MAWDDYAVFKIFSKDMDQLVAIEKLVLMKPIRLFFLARVSIWSNILI